MSNWRDIADRLPFETPRPEGPRGQKWATILRIAAYALLAVALLVPVIQFQCAASDILAGQKEAKAATEPTHDTKGAIWRWGGAIRAFWAGQNIYVAESEERATTGEPAEFHLHPNMPFVVILLTPLAYLPIWAMGLAWDLSKIVVLVATGLMVVRVANDGPRRMPDWVLGLGVLWTLPMLLGDIQHGNTNIFVLGAIALHLWLYRRGREGWAGAALALAICLKMTPALFLLYWLFQRNWRVLGGAVVALAVFVGAAPLLAVGPHRYVELTGTWLNNLIVPGLVRSAFYPIHINQSLPAVLSRLFLDGPGGNIFWNSDDNPYSRQDKFQWITLVALSPETVKIVTRLCQTAIVALAMAAIGWRRLPRDDGRRGLHYALVVIGMLILNQRTWDHHAAILLVAAVPLWYGICMGRMSRRARAWALGLMIAGGAILWLSRMESLKAIAWLLGRTREQAKAFADVVEAYGPLCFYLLLLLAAAAILLFALRRSELVFAQERQKL